MRSPSLYISEIISAIDSIEDFTSGMNKDDFLKDEKTKSAVVRQFEIMGEAGKALPKSITELAPDIP